MTFREKVFAGVAVGSIALAGFAYYQYREGLGHGDHHGNKPNLKIGETRSADIDHFTVVYLSLNSTGALDVKHAYFKTTCEEPAADCIDEDVYKVIKGRFPNKQQEWLNSDTATYGPLAIKNPRTGSSLVDDFKNFYFGRKMRVYVFSDMPNIRFDEKWPIMFTKFGYESRAIENSKYWIKKDENKTISKASLISIEDIPNTHLLYFENDFKDNNGDDATVPQIPPNPAKKFVELSINFNMWWKTDTGEIPMVIDPDTGNGVGSPPPP